MIRQPDPRPLPPKLQGAPDVPLDHPGAHRPHRLYLALTTSCNRACPWCSTSSSPRGRTHLSTEHFDALLPDAGPFELQFEGGEPLVHPEFWALWQRGRAHPRCATQVLCTNGVSVPRSSARLADFVTRIGAPTRLKLSWNHHLRDQDPGLLDLATALAALARERQGFDFVLNVRVRPGRDDDVRDAVAGAGLAEVANVFFLERYGLASGEQDWEPPRAVWGDFTLANPDGRAWGTDLVARAAAMAELP